MAPHWFVCVILLIALSDRAFAGESAEAIFPSGGIERVLISPDGRWVVAKAVVADKQSLLVQRVGLPGIAQILKSSWIGEVAWDSAGSLVFEAYTRLDRYAVYASKLRVRGPSIEFDLWTISAPGRWVHSLPYAPDELIWQFQFPHRTSLHRVAIAELVEFYDHARFSSHSVVIGREVAVVNGPVERWIVDRDGNVRAAVRSDAEGYSLLMPAGENGPLEAVYRFSESRPERAIFPVGLTRSGARVIVSAYNGNDTRGLYEFDRKAAAPGNPIFTDPEFDVDDVLSDPLTGDLIAAVYDSSGERRYEYFPEYRDRFLSKLPPDWRRESISVESGTADRQVFVLRDASATNPGDFHLRQRDGQIRRIGQLGPNVDREKLVEVDSFRVRSGDGTEVEAFLALPKNEKGPAPLVVMPHGGPKGVRDSRSYNPFLQYLASWGFAVLQVNYRGSSGYGLEFEKLGKKAWARGIEDDIDAAVEHAMSLPEVDEARVCIVGGSYGGFSALVSVIRHEDRYRCAVSLNGVSDIPLLYDSSEGADYESVIDFYKEFVGDPATERDELIAISPAYHVAEIETPILVVHGTDDRRVDPDHAHRMAMMLELLGKQHETLAIEGAGHQFDRDESVIVVRAVRRFLSRYLVPDEPFELDPET